MKNKGIIAGLGLLASVSIFILADYAGLFGISSTPEYELREIKLRITDNEDNSPIVHTRAKCFQKFNDNACSQRVSKKVGIVSLMVPVIKIASYSLVFDKGEKYLPAKDPELQVMLIHTDYMTKTISINIADYLAQATSILPVSLQARGKVNTRILSDTGENDE